MSELGVKTREISSLLLYVPTVARGDLDLVNNHFQIIPSREHLGERRGTLLLQGKLPEKKVFSLEYLLNDRGMNTLRTFNHGLEALEKEGESSVLSATKDEKWL